MRKRDTDTLAWERWDARTERAVIGVQTSRPEPHEPSNLRGFLNLTVVQENDTWAWSAEHITLHDDGGAFASGIVSRQDHARRLCQLAAELYLDDRSSDGLYGVPG